MKLTQWGLHTSQGGRGPTLWQLWGHPTSIWKTLAVTQMKIPGGFTAIFWDLGEDSPLYPVGNPSL